MAKVTTGKVRLSYVTVATPRKASQDADAKERYSVQLIIDKNDKRTLNAFEQAIQELKSDPKQVAKMDGKVSYISNPLRDGDTDPAVEDQPETYAGKYFVNAGNYKQPSVFAYKNGTRTQLEPYEIEDEVYSGCYAQVILNLYAYNVSGNKGVGCGLNGLMKVADGERLGGAKVSADDFDLAEEPSNFDNFNDDDINSL